MFTRTHSFPSQRAQVTSNLKILRYVTRTVYSCFSSTDEAAASKRMEDYGSLSTISRNNESLLSFSHP